MDVHQWGVTLKAFFKCPQSHPLFINGAILLIGLL